VRRRALACRRATSPPARAEENFARRRATDLAALQKKTSHVFRTSNGFRTFKELMKKSFAWV